MTKFRKIVEKILKEAHILNVYNPGDINHFGIRKEGIIKVLVNPSYHEYKSFKYNIPNHEVRLIYGTDNNIYVWDGNMAIHNKMLYYLEKQFGMDINTKLDAEDHANGKLYFDGYVEDPRFSKLFQDNLNEYNRAMIVGKCVRTGAKQGYIKFNTPKEAQYAYKLLMNGLYEDYPSNYEFTLDENDPTRINCEL